MTLNYNFQKKRIDLHYNIETNHIISIIFSSHDLPIFGTYVMKPKSSAAASAVPTPFVADSWRHFKGPQHVDPVNQRLANWKITHVHR